MKQFIILILFTILLAFKGYSQQYTQAIGIRGGLSSGFEYRVYTDDLNSYKLLFSTRERGLQLTAFKEFHKYDIFDFSEQFTFVYGIGIHAGYERWDVYHYTNNTRWSDTKTSLISGLDALAALEYSFYEAPVSVGVEVKPFFNVWGRRAFDVQLFDFAFTLKYLF